ncbi:hypothetical protein [Candidatus Poriferisodalis sp.]|uniref:hypothetical protein n=1 Tax=Candidatus Poriferisodalis sp. TaxID=3101277 RepID=UPI003B01C7BB
MPRISRRGEAAGLGTDAVSDVLVVADVHGDARNLSDAFNFGIDAGVKAIVQVGDF